MMGELEHRIEEIKLSFTKNVSSGSVSDEGSLRVREAKKAVLAEGQELNVSSEEIFDKRGPLRESLGIQIQDFETRRGQRDKMKAVKALKESMTVKESLLLVKSVGFAESDSEPESSTSRNIEASDGTDMSSIDRPSNLRVDQEVHRDPGLLVSGASNQTLTRTGLNG